MVESALSLYIYKHYELETVLTKFLFYNEIPNTETGAYKKYNRPKLFVTRKKKCLKEELLSKYILLDTHTQCI